MSIGALMSTVNIFSKHHYDHNRCTHRRQKQTACTLRCPLVSSSVLACLNAGFRGLGRRVKSCGVGSEHSVDPSPHTSS